MNWSSYNEGMIELYLTESDLMSVANVSMPKDILALKWLKSETIKFIWLILSTIRQNGDIVPWYLLHW